MIIKFFDYSGEFCTRRTTPGLLELKETLRRELGKGTFVILSLEGVKIITPSYIDELLPTLMIELGKEKVLGQIKFEPKLNKYVEGQIERGYRARVPVIP